MRAPTLTLHNSPKILQPFSSRRGDNRRKNDNNSAFSGFSRSAFGTAEPTPAAAPAANHNNNRSKTQRPVKDADDWNRVEPIAPAKEVKEKVQAAPKVEKAGGAFAGFDDEDEDEKPTPEPVKKAEKAPKAAAKPVEAAPRFAAVVDNNTAFTRTTSSRDERPARNEDRAPREPRAEGGRAGGFDKTPSDFAGGSRFAGFESGPSDRGFGRGGDRPQREERPNRGGDRRDFGREERAPFPARDEPVRAPKPQPQQPPAPKEEPKTVTAGTNKDGVALGGSVVTEKKATGTAGLSQMQTQSASWATAAPAAATAGVSFGGSSEKQQPKQQATKTTALTQLQKAVEGKQNTISLGQLKKNIQEIVPFPTTENAEQNFATAISNAISESEYSIADIVTIFNQQFVNVYTKKGGADGKKNGIDVGHQILVAVVKNLLGGSDAEKAIVSDYFTKDTTALFNFTPDAIFSMADGADKKAKAVEFFKKNGLVACLSADDGNEELAAAQKSAAAALDAKIATALIALPAPVSVAHVAAIITPLQAEIKTALGKNATKFITSLFAPIVEKNLPAATVVSLLDAMFAASLITYDTIDNWQSQCDQAAVKREMTFKISGWLSAHKPQIQSYDDEEEDEPFDDGF